MANVWIIGCGNNILNEWETMWPEWKADEIITIGCWANNDFVADWDFAEIVQYIEGRHEEAREAGHEPGDTAKGQAGIIKHFINMEKNDLVIARSGKNSVLGIGVVDDDKITVSQTPMQPGSHHLLRKIRWLKTRENPIALDGISFPRITVARWKIEINYNDQYDTDHNKLLNAVFSGDEQHLSKLNKVISILGVNTSTKANDRLDRKEASLSSRTNSSTGNNMNEILYGTPGTGKTHALTSLALSILAPNQEDDANYITYAQNITNGAALSKVSNKDYQSWHAEFQKLVHAGRVEFTTFHQNYAYEDFVEGLKAELDEKTGTVQYKIEPGILKRIAYRALYSWLTGKAPSFELSGDQMTRVMDYLSGKVLHGEEPEKIPNYVLIIDEINRGNVARIFGELITLVEESKRACRKITPGSQPVFATLPYTKERFILPPNLHIIGTMNTADRSLIGLDAALRRRFDFVELPPRPELLGDDVDGINLQVFLRTLNQKIEQMDTRDHCIGHAYFMVANSFNDIREVMRRKVIPQLQEYFHDRPAELKKLLTVGERSFVNDKGVIDSDALGIRDMYTGFASQ